MSMFFSIDIQHLFTTKRPSILLLAMLSFVAAILLPHQARAGETYVIDPSHSHVQFSFERFGFNAILGEFRTISGEITLDEANPENSSVRATLGVASAVSGDATRDEHMAGEHWLNAAAYPTIEFVSTSVEQHGETEATIVGDLTLLGMTMPVTFHVRLNKLGEDRVTQKKAAGFSSSGSLKRSAFGLNTALGFISDEVDFRIETLAHKSE